MDGDFDLESLVHVEQSYGNIWSDLDDSFSNNYFYFADSTMQGTRMALLMDVYTA